MVAEAYRCVQNGRGGNAYEHLSERAWSVQEGKRELVYDLICAIISTMSAPEALAGGGFGAAGGGTIA